MGYDLENNKTDEGVRKLYEAVVKNGRSLVGIINSISEDDTSILRHFSNGNLFVIKEEANGFIDYYLKYLNQKELFFFKAPHILEKDSILNECLADNCVTSSKILDASITTFKLEDASVTSSKIKDENVLSDHIKSASIFHKHLTPDCVYEVNILDDSISTPKLQNKSVTTDKIADSAVTTSKIKDRAIDYSKIDYQAVGESQLAMYCVTNSKIANGAVTYEKLENQSVLSSKIRDRAVTRVKIDYGAVSSAEIANDAITSSKIVNGQVTSQKLSQDIVNILNTAVCVHNGIATVNGRFESYDIKTSYLTVGGVATLNFAECGYIHSKQNIDANGTITGQRVYNPQYGDLAEGYIPGEKCEPGDIIEIREDQKAYRAKNKNSCIIGVMSDEYAICLNSKEHEITDYKKIPVGLIGKISVNINGKVKMGDYIGIDENGIGKAYTNYGKGVIGKALENKDTESIQKVLCLIFPS